MPHKRTWWHEKPTWEIFLPNSAEIVSRLSANLPRGIPIIVEKPWWQGPSQRKMTVGHKTMSRTLRLSRRSTLNIIEVRTSMVVINLSSFSFHKDSGC